MTPKKKAQKGQPKKGSSLEEKAAAMTSAYEIEGSDCWQRLLMEIPLVPVDNHHQRAKEICRDMCTSGNVRMAALMGFTFNYREFIAIHYRLARAVQPTGKVKPLSSMLGAIVLNDKKRANHAKHLLDKEIATLKESRKSETLKHIEDVTGKPPTNHRNYQVWVAVNEVLTAWSVELTDTGKQAPFPDRGDVRRWILKQNKDTRFRAMQEFDEKGWNRLWRDSGVQTGEGAFNMLRENGMEELERFCSSPEAKKLLADEQLGFPTAILEQGTRGQASHR